LRKIDATICVLAVFALASCRPVLTPVPIAPGPAASSLPPLPTPVAPANPAATPAAAASGIHLTATIGPTCPGPERPGQVCTRPYQGLFVVTNNTGAEAARATTDQNGDATINLPPGDYTITPKVEGRLPSGAPTAVTVLSGQTVEVSVELDSGIR
jgi:hypothetical protein